LILDATAAAEGAIQSCLAETVGNALVAGECALNAVDEWVDRMLRPGLVTTGPGEFQAVQHNIDHHPLMVRELDQMRLIVAFLRKCPTLDKSRCAELRALWPNGSKSNIDLE
jgi:hypothetical protein